MGIEEWIKFFERHLDFAICAESDLEIVHHFMCLWYWIDVEQMVNNKENK